MAHRSRRGVACFLIVLISAACSTANSGATTTTVPRPTSTTSTTPTATTTITPSPPTTPTTTTTPPSTTTTGEPVASTTIGPDIDAEVRVPDGEGPFPAIVLVHGGGWVAGGPSAIAALARFLADNGFLTVNTRYTLSTQGHPGYPDAVSDVACAVNYAASLPESDGTVAIVGHSAGAHIGAIVALDGRDYIDGCSTPGTGVPERFVGLAGPYDIARLGLGGLLFFGESQESDPQAWEKGNPQNLTDDNPNLDSLIMYGDRDGIVPPGFAIDFYNALVASGGESLLEPVEGAFHNDLRDPDIVGDLIVTWLDR